MSDDYKDGLSMAITKRKVTVFILGFLFVPLMAVLCFCGQAFFEHFDTVWYVVAEFIQWGLVIGVCVVIGMVAVDFFGDPKNER